MPTLSDVAAEAGVTQMTVSNVLNGRTTQVSAVTAERVMEAVRRLGYVPNATARALSAKDSKIIALVFRAAPPGAAALASPHDSVFLGEVERCVNEAGRYLMVRSAENLLASAASLRSWNVDGAIFLGTVAAEVDDLLKHHNVPLVFTDNYSVSPLVSNVGVDDHLGGYLAAERLIKAGHRRIAFVSPPRPGNGVMAQRYRGFVEALTAHGLALDPLETFECDLSFDAAVTQGELLADPRATRTAIFAPADLLAIGLIKGLHRGGISVPIDVSVVGFDDLPISRQTSPELTTIHQDVPAKARAAVEMTLRLIAAGAEAPPERLTLSVSIAERETVAGPRS